MLENGLFDVLGRAGKAPGGYSDDLADFRSPFIFANFNGTSDDINVLTHESGHALEYYLARDVYPPDYAFPTAEACEIHSMSMEFLTWPYMELFFGGDAGKYRYQHLSHALTFIPYGCTVDEFQQIVYENPSLTPAERKKAWRELEKKYTPWIDYGDDRFFGTGGRWQRQLHIYMFPFYYIDYCLAETCALQFWAMAQKDRVDALDRYLALCRLGGTDVFTELINKVGLRSPFEKGCLDGAAAQAVSWLDDPANAKF
jgi:M3 family oligoendopeptidase